MVSPGGEALSGFEPPEEVLVTQKCAPVTQGGRIAGTQPALWAAAGVSKARFDAGLGCCSNWRRHLPTAIPDTIHLFLTLIAYGGQEKPKE